MINKNTGHKFIFAIFLGALGFVAYLKLQRSESSLTLNEFSLPNLSSHQIETPFSTTTSNTQFFVVHFWASWCGPCKEEMPSLLKAAKELPLSTRIIAVNLDDERKQALEFLQAFHTEDSPVLFLFDADQSVAKIYGTNKLPETYILDNHRKLMRKIAGPMDWLHSTNLTYLKNLGISTDSSSAIQPSAGQNK